MRKRQPSRQRSGLADALFSTTQQRVLGLLLGQPDRTFTLSELIRLANTGSGTVQREIERLSGAGIIIVTPLAGRKQVQANADAPIFQELRSIIEKTSGVEAQLRKALEPENAKVDLAILYGSLAKGSDRSASDVDVLIVSDDLTQEAAFSLFHETEGRLGRRVSPTIYTRNEFRKRRQDEQPFLTKVLSGPHVVLIGSEDALAA